MINFLFFNFEKLVFRVFLASIFFLHYELAQLPGSLHGLLLILGLILLAAKSISDTTQGYNKLDNDVFLAYLLLGIVIISFFVSLIGMNETKEPILSDQWLNLRAYAFMPLAFIYVRYLIDSEDLKFLFEVCKWFIILNSTLMVLQLLTGSFYIARYFAAGDPPLIIPSGFSDGPTKNGMLIIYALSIVIGCIITGKSKGLFLNWVAVFLGLGTLVLAASRAAFFGIFAVILIAGFIYLIIRARSGKGNFIATAFVSIFALSLISSALVLSNTDGFQLFLETYGQEDKTVRAVGHKATNIVDSSLLERFEIWIEFIARLGDNILATLSFGHGPGYSLAVNEGMNIHNSYLEMLYQLGLVGVIIFLCMLFIVLKRAYNSKNPIYIPIFLALISIMVFMMAHDVIRGRLFWTALGILAASATITKPNKALSK